MSELPDGWEIKRLDEIADIVMGQSPPGSSYNEHGEGQPFFQGKTEFGEVHPTVRKYTTAGTKFAKAGDILMSVRAPVGPTNIAVIDCVIGRGLAAIRAQAAVSQNYLRWSLKHLEIDIQSKGTGTTFDAITGETLRGTLVALPSMEEQHKIVELLEDHLSRLDAALADVKQAKIKAEQFRRSLLQAGLSGFFNTGPRDEITRLPKTWRLRTLADVADWTSGGTPSSKDSTLYGGEIPWIVIGDLTEGLVLETERKITQKGLDSSSAKKLPAGTVMVAMYGASIGRTGVMGMDMATNQAIACGFPKDEAILGQYLLYFLQSQKNDFIAAGKGGAQPNISQGVVKSWQIPLPPKDEQLQIINEIESQLEHLTQANKATETLLKESTGLRRSLLQAAFTGQLTKEVIKRCLKAK
jgi:type I restriction enzyme S subunit